MGPLYTIYVIELVNAARRGRNPDPSKPYLYVGVTALTPEARFRKHKEGGRTASRIVTRHGLRLRPDLYEKKFKRSRSRDLAAQREQAAAVALRKQGYIVFSGGKGYFWDKYKKSR